MTPRAEIIWLAEHRKSKDAVFRAVCRHAHADRRLVTMGLSFRDYPQTAARVSECLRRAKKQPRSGLARWLKRQLIRGQYNWARRYFGARPDVVAMCWNGLTGSRRAFMCAAQDAGVARLFVELAPLPGRVTLDPRGVNAEGSVPQDPAFYDPIMPRMTELSQMRDAFSARASRRRDVGQAEGALADAGPFLFVPLQVPDDSQMRLFAGWAQSLEGFIAALAAASRGLPDGWHIRLKEHPSSKVPATDQLQAAIDAGARFVIDNATDSFAQIRASEGVVTVNSSMGLQAMFFDKPVIATGQAYWALPGLAVTAGSAQELGHILQAPENLTFDAEFRARFLSWLIDDYYPAMSPEAEIAESVVLKKIAEARQAAAE